MTQLSTRRVVIIFVLVMCISLTANVFLLQKIHKQGEPVVTPPTFYQLIDSINENFSYTGYNEILNHSNLFMALPQQANDDTLPKRSKVFVYKGIDKNVVIMLGISYSEVATDLSEEWYASYDYSPQILNSADDLFGYNRNLPSVLVCTNSFRLSGFNYTITCFSNNQSDMLAQNELTAFSNALLAFLSEKR